MSTLIRYVVSLNEDGPGYAATEDYSEAATRAALDHAMVLEQHFELVSQEVALDKREGIQIDTERDCWYCRSHVMGTGECSVCGAASLITKSRIPAVREFIKEAAKSLLFESLRSKHIAYEQNQWWLTDTKTGKRWKAIDSTGPGSHYGIGFQEVGSGKDKQ